MPGRRVMPGGVAPGAVMPGRVVRVLVGRDLGGGARTELTAGIAVQSRPVPAGPGDRGDQHPDRGDDQRHAVADTSISDRDHRGEQAEEDRDHRPRQQPRHVIEQERAGDGGDEQTNRDHAEQPLLLGAPTLPGHGGGVRLT